MATSYNFMCILLEPSPDTNLAIIKLITTKLFQNVIHYYSAIKVQCTYKTHVLTPSVDDEYNYVVV